MQGQGAAAVDLSGILSSSGNGLLNMPPVIWGLVALVAIVTVFVAARIMLQPKGRATTPADIDCAFTFDGRSLMSVSGPGQLFLNRAGAGEPLEQLKAVFGEDVLTDDIDRLIASGTRFARRVGTVDGQMMQVEGRPVGGMALVAVKTDEPVSGDTADTGRELRALRREVTMLKGVLNAAPGLNLALNDKDEALWRNEALAALDEEGKIAQTLKQARAERVRLPGTDGEEHWYTLRHAPLPGGTQAVFATPIDTLVAAEQSLANFVSTLTETFAHLTTGLAIFDSEGKLSLFNPALADLTGADPTRLIAQPTIRAFLELLRDLRMVPEQRDFTAWRQTITRLERGAREGTYREDWTLPSGRVFRVIGRPHPNGAVALIFEDISSTVTLERRYRDEIELGQAALDRISDAVAIFDTGGSLVFANDAFDTLWQIDTMSTLEAPDIAHMARRWTESCLPTPIWDRLRSYVTSDQSRTSWQSEVSTRDGRYLQAQFSPLPNGSTLTVFSRSLSDTSSDSADAMPESARDTLLAMISEDLATGVSGTQGSDTGAAIGLLRALVTLPGRHAEQDAGTLADHLRDFAAGRDCALSFGTWDWAGTEDIPPGDVTLVWTFLLTALETGGVKDSDTCLRLSVTRTAGSLDIRAEHPGLGNDTDTLPYRYLKRLTSRCCARPELTMETGTLRLRCTTAAPVAEDPAPPLAYPMN